MHYLLISLTYLGILLLPLLVAATHSKGHPPDDDQRKP